ncbi:MAG: YpdA family putative bacillithiol disulfide reductase [Rhodothermales bacterium]
MANTDVPDTQETARPAYDTVVVGAGPVGLACAIELKRIGHRVLVVDKGALVNSLIGYPTNMEFFSTPELLEIGNHPFSTRNYKPRREEALDYYRKVAQTEALELALFEEVLRLDGEQGAFILHTAHARIRARFVVVATGFFDIPNRLGVPGDERAIHYYKEPYAYAGRRVVIVGAKNSAAKAALDCRRNGADVTMIVRGPDIGASVKYWIRPDLLNRIEEGAIRAFFNSRILRLGTGTLTFQTGNEPSQTIPNDVVLALTGYRPNYDLLSALGVTWQDDHAWTPLYDPETFESHRSGVFLAGTVCGGLNTSRWFIENGRFHAARIAAELDGR